MATWTDVASYLRSNYKVMLDEGTLLKLAFNVDDGRSQSILVSRGTMDSSEQEWAVISSPFASSMSVNLRAVLEEVSDYVVGGVVAYGDTLAVRHTVPLAELDLNEFTEPFRLILLAADLLEKQFSGGDHF